MDAASENGAWVTHGERLVYESDWVRVGLADISVPSGERFEHHTVWFPPVAMAVVLDNERSSVLLSWRHRFAPNIWNWELPGGIIDPGEEPIDTVRREITEETGYRAESIKHLITFEPAVGMLRNPNHVYLAQDITLVSEPEELNEGKFRWVSRTQIPELIQSGQISNSGTLVALLHLLSISGPELADK
ncbi:NUDIX hydrolase [Saccharopolyspora erythraea]|uniref:NUDIX hydrolase n=1 Tax=Saccharopolyspora erythraea TaxID=1836 RepID=UPI001BAD9BA2|nr:NUDIX hydrolase [Saccharopolyspora erythraea]QUG99807.1 NUDIX hydrolase [Saccharopolyspora erythraea]